MTLLRFCFFISFLFALFVPDLILAQKKPAPPSVRKEDSTIHAYIERYKNLAISEMKRTGFPASIKIAQGIIETQAGTSDLVLQSNNHFGLKCKTNWKGERVFHDDDAEGECFRKYPTDSLSYIDQSNYVKNSARYKSLFSKNPLDYKAWAAGLKKAGYATNPKYIHLLIEKIEDWGLQRYSLLALHEEGQIKDKEYDKRLASVAFKKSSIYDALSHPSTSPTLIASANTNDGLRLQPTTNDSTVRISATLAIASTIEDEYGLILGRDDGEKNMDKRTRVIPKMWTPTQQKIVRINRRKAIRVPASTSLLSIAVYNDIPYAAVLAYNDFKPDANVTLQEQYIFIRPKKNKSQTPFHVMTEHQTLYDVAQQYGVYLSKIREYNYLAPGMEPKAHQKVYLRDMAPRRPDIY